MRTKVVGLFAAVAFGLAAWLSPAPASAQTLEEAQSFTNWASQYRQVVLTFLGPLQATPQPPSREMNRAERRAWSESAHAWALSAQEQFASARSHLEQLPPPPPAAAAFPEPLIASIVGLRTKLAETIGAMDQVAVAYLEMAAAVERNDFDRVDQLRVVSVESAMLTMRLFQAMNVSQVEGVNVGNPQRSLLRSYSMSYDALWQLLNYKHDIMLRQVADRPGTAVAMASIAAQMRAAVATGRSDLVAVQAQVANPEVMAGVPEEELRRYRQILATFDRSFDREIAMTDILDQIVTLLRDPREIAIVEPPIDALVAGYASLDLERMADIQRRAGIIAAP